MKNQGKWFITTFFNMNLNTVLSLDLIGPFEAKYEAEEYALQHETDFPVYMVVQSKDTAYIEKYG